MTKETTQSLRELLTNLDAIYRVHTRLYKLNHALYATALSNLKATKINSVGITGATIGALLAFMTIAITVLGINRLTVPILIISAIIIFIGYLGVLSYNNASRAQKEFESIIGTYEVENVCGGIENWFDFTLDEISKWSTRVSIIKKILSDEKLPIKTKELYEKQLNYCKERFEKIKTINETLYMEKKRNKKEYNQIKTFAEDAIKMME